MPSIAEITRELPKSSRTWLITGVAGFIGSNLLETLLKLEQRVRGLDDFSTGKAHNLEQVQALVTPEQWARFALVTGNITDAAVCRAACAGVDFVLHQAALGSVPRSLEEPLLCHSANVTGFLHVLEAARVMGVKRLVYASSSAVYGDHPGLPKVETEIGKPLSPYAASKRINEIYADAYAQAYGFESIGLRYFNVFGPRQDPNGAYAAVIPKWIDALLSGAGIIINGDGETSRDFCYIQNVVEANLLAAMMGEVAAVNQVYNIAAGGRTTLNELFELLRSGLQPHHAGLVGVRPHYGPERAGDIRHSHADIAKARRGLGYEPALGVEAGLALAMDWYRTQASARQI
jgi:UDP-N-acetylglucosamine 4-epimerase